MQSGNPNGLQMIGSPLHCVAVRLRREAFGVPAAALSKLQVPAAVSFPLHGDGIIRIGPNDQAGIEFRRLPILKEGGSPKAAAPTATAAPAPIRTRRVAFSCFIGSPSSRNSGSAGRPRNQIEKILRREFAVNRFTRPRFSNELA